MILVLATLFACQSNPVEPDAATEERDAQVTLFRGTVIHAGESLTRDDSESIRIERHIPLLAGDGYGPIAGSVSALTTDCGVEVDFTVTGASSSDPSVVNATFTPNQFVVDPLGEGAATVTVNALLTHARLPADAGEGDADAMSECLTEWQEHVGTDAEFTWHINVDTPVGVRYGTRALCGATSTWFTLVDTELLVPYTVVGQDGMDLGEAVNWQQGARFGLLSGRGDTVLEVGQHTIGFQVNQVEEISLKSHLGDELFITVVDEQSITDFELSFVRDDGERVHHGDYVGRTDLAVTLEAVHVDGGTLCEPAVAFEVLNATPTICHIQYDQYGNPESVMFGGTGVCELTAVMAGIEYPFSFEFDRCATPAH